MVFNFNLYHFLIIFPNLFAGTRGAGGGVSIRALKTYSKPVAQLGQITFQEVPGLIR